MISHCTVPASVTGAAGAFDYPSYAALHEHHRRLSQIIPKQTPWSPKKFQKRIRELSDTSNTNTTSGCPGAPFLWKIVEDATEKHVGFGVGTMHLPAEIVTTDNAYFSILSAIEDSCDVFGELNLLDSAVTAALVQCLTPLQLASARVADIPDEGLRDAFTQAVRAISSEISPNSAAAADAVSTALLSQPLFNVQSLISFANTPEYRQIYLQSILTGVEADALDTDILQFGRPSGSLEEVQTQCDALEFAYLSPEDLAENFDTLSEGLEASLNATLSSQIASYMCGDVDAWTEDYLEMFFDSSAGLTAENQATLLDDRNVVMAERIDEALRANPDAKTLFAVGNAHWLIGEKRLVDLLKEYGYTLEHVDVWEKEDAEDATNEECGVTFDATLGYFVPSETSSPVSQPSSKTPAMSPTDASPSLEPTEAPAESPTYDSATVGSQTDGPRSSGIITGVSEVVAIGLALCVVTATVLL